MSGSGGGGSSTTVQKADPWSGVQPYLNQLYGGASQAYNNAPQIYPGSGVAAPGQYTADTLARITERANDGHGSPLEQQAQQQTAAMANLTDPYSQMLQRMQTDTRGGWQNILNGNTAATGSLVGQINGNTATGQVLHEMAYGQDASSQMYGKQLAGNDEASQLYKKQLAGGDDTSQYLKNVLGGGYLNGNPYLSGMVDSANRDVTRQFKDAVMPGLASQFSLAGRYGSGAQSQGISDATRNLGQTLTDNATNIYGANYANERAIQDASAGRLSGLQSGAAQGLSGIQSGAAGSLAALRGGAATNLGNYIQNATGQLGGFQQAAMQGMQAGDSAYNQLLSGRQQGAVAALPGMAAIDWNNLNQRASVGDYMDQYQQRLLDDQVNKFNQQQQQPWQQLQNYNQILNGAMSLNGQTQNQSGGSGGLRSALGGAAGGAALGTAIMPGWGTAIGAGAGALMSLF